MYIVEGMLIEIEGGNNENLSCTTKRFSHR